MPRPLLPDPQPLPRLRRSASLDGRLALPPLPKPHLRLSQPAVVGLALDEVRLPEVADEEIAGLGEGLDGGARGGERLDDGGLALVAAPGGLHASPLAHRSS